MTEKTTENSIKTPMSDKTFAKLIIPSVVAIIICMVALCGTTFAWLSDTNESGKNKITSGFFNVTVTTVKCDGTPCEKLDEKGFLYLVPVADNRQKLEISAERDAGASKKGYVLVEYIDADGNNVKPPQMWDVNDYGSLLLEITVTDIAGEFKVRITPVFGAKPTP